MTENEKIIENLTKSRINANKDKILEIVAKIKKRINPGIELKRVRFE